MKFSFFILAWFVFPFSVFALDNQSNQFSVTLSKCVDGNSARFILENNEIKVRFIGVESNSVVVADVNDEINGSLVSEYVCNVLKNAKDIKLEYENNSEKEDKYGRKLVWVWVDGVLLQENLVKIGYSKIAYLSDDYKYSDLLLSAEDYAKNNELGIWYKENVVDTNVSDSQLQKNENLFSTILNFINGILEKIVKFIDNIIEEMQ